ncbi:MAG: M48 family metallopeptidase [Gammaproteobacteria bacterium]|nr:M48 family metallopeptidase [Gammaproteobacteria bacterium]MBP6051651.1 M48 family metallopeptidase [Pseudomonadales bacterium]MBK6584661.1 M48 family metallopeptidase [Gammaproteobacteria bacterium]MBK7170964.1 M48 family metallopeptidase [Gammaproteobacteria bacterium]MBK7519830.1 M48 family metallopeptidase [Gammaproteobacteria bacterium]
MHSIELDDGRRVPYSIRVSRRSRRVRLTIDPRNGVVMVTPPGVDRQWLTELAASWRGWVATQIDQMGIGELQPTTGDRVALPDCIELAALGERWEICYRYTPSAAARVRQSGAGRLLLSGDCANHGACRRALVRWLGRRAREVLPAWLEEVSAATGLPFSSVVIRAQRSRWGSCSAKGDISLNYQLLFLPRELARHVLLHELCHTVELNHSARFWRTVHRFEPELERMRKDMRRSWSHVPAWVNEAA